MVREADEIYLEELRESGHYDNIGQAFAVLLPCKSVGVMGDGRTYEQVRWALIPDMQRFLTPCGCCSSGHCLARRGNH